MPSPFLTALSQRWATLLERLHDPVCRECGVAMTPSGFQEAYQVYCDACLRSWGFSSQGVSTPDSNIVALCQLTAPLKKLIYGHKFYGGQQAYRSLYRLWLQGESVLNGVLACGDVVNQNNSGPVWVVSIPSRYRQESDEPSTVYRPLERLVASVCRGWSSSRLNRSVEYMGPAALEWQRDTWLQHRLTLRKERLANMHQALVINDALWQQRLTSQGPPSAIVVLDDLVTTGATAQAALKAVELWCQAHNLSRIPQKMLALAYVPLE